METSLRPEWPTLCEKSFTLLYILACWEYREIIKNSQSFDPNRKSNPKSLP